MMTWNFWFKFGPDSRCKCTILSQAERRLRLQCKWPHHETLFHAEITGHALMQMENWRVSFSFEWNQHWGLHVSNAWLSIIILFYDSNLGVGRVVWTRIGVHFRHHIISSSWFVVADNLSVGRMVWTSVGVHFQHHIVSSSWFVVAHQQNGSACPSMHITFPVDGHGAYSVHLVGTNLIEKKRIYFFSAL